MAVNTRNGYLARYSQQFKNALTSAVNWRLSGKKLKIVNTFIIIILVLGSLLFAYFGYAIFNKYKHYFGYDRLSAETLQNIKAAQEAYFKDHQHYLTTGTKKDYEELTKYGLQKQTNMNYGRIYPDEVDGEPGYYVQVSHDNGERSWYSVSNKFGQLIITEEAVDKYPGLNINGVNSCKPSWWDNLWGNEQLKSESVWCD